MTSFCVQGGGGVKKAPKHACILMQSSQKVFTLWTGQLEFWQNHNHLNGKTFEFWEFYFLTCADLQCICVLHVMLCAICTFFLVEKGIIDLLALWRRIPSPRKKYMFIVLRNVFPGSCSFILSFLQSGIAYFFKGGQGGGNYLNVWL